MRHTPLSAELLMLVAGRCGDAGSPAAAPVSHLAGQAQPPAAPPADTDVSRYSFR